jgi:hypothetical protein
VDQVEADLAVLLLAVQQHHMGDLELIIRVVAVVDLCQPQELEILLEEQADQV